MAEEKPLTPEQQLLKLIEEKEDKGAPGGVKSPLHAAVAKRKAQSLFSADAFKGRFAFFKGRVKKDFKVKGAYGADLKLANNGLRFCVVFLAGYLVFSVPYSAVYFKEAMNLELKSNCDTKPSGMLAVSLLKATSYYLEKARERNIFKIRVTRSEEKASKTPFSTIGEATKSLKLVGISWSDDPDVMIEDMESKKTFFLKKGQLINNSIKLEAVFRDKVVLSYLGEEIELK
ncbi:MAG: hypothetical protein JW788_00395 [Candidatus Omnitrophica bacterium]|nr:hypothetical protein [Candidatus Omnitrophota bacterium]